MLETGINSFIVQHDLTARDLEELLTAWVNILEEVHSTDRSVNRNALYNKHLDRRLINIINAYAYPHNRKDSTHRRPSSFNTPGWEIHKQIISAAVRSDINTLPKVAPNMLFAQLAHDLSEWADTLEDTILDGFYSYFSESIEDLHIWAIINYLAKSNNLKNLNHTYGVEDPLNFVISFLATSGINTFVNHTMAALKSAVAEEKRPVTDKRKLSNVDPVELEANFRILHTQIMRTQLSVFVATEKHGFDDDAQTWTAGVCPYHQNDSRLNGVEKQAMCPAYPVMTLITDRILEGLKLES